MPGRSSSTAVCSLLYWATARRRRATAQDLFYKGNVPLRRSGAHTAPSGRPRVPSTRRRLPSNCHMSWPVYPVHMSLCRGFDTGTKKKTGASGRGASPAGERQWTALGTQFGAWAPVWGPFATRWRTITPVQAADGRGSLPLQNLVSDSAHPHHV